MHPTRLFDCIRLRIEKDPLSDILAYKENGTWKKYNSTEVFNIVNSLSAGLLKLGISPGDGTVEGRDKIAIISKNRPEWIMLDLAIQQIGAVVTPIYPTVGINDLRFILLDAKVKMVFVNDKELFDKVNSIKNNLPFLNIIFTFENIEQLPYWKSILTNDNSLYTEVEKISSAIRFEDLATIIYTSGTTGNPKGVMLSHKNILSNVIDSTPYLPKGKNYKALSFLPLNHIFERMMSYLYLYNGTTIYFAESLETIAENLREIKPQIFTTVPRLLEKVYEKIMQKGNELKGIKKIIFFWAHKLATRFEINSSKPFIYKIQLFIANILVFKKWRKAMGNNIICIVSGGAPCQVRIIRIFAAAKLAIQEGYGLTETSPVISVNRMEEKNRCFGTVGLLINNVEVKIEPDGEILCKGPNIMMGYYKNPDLTHESIINGWFKTGDIGEMIDGRFLKITDRKKEIFKTSGGKYVAPLIIENKLKESRYIENVIVTGAGKKFVGALVVPSFINIKLWCNENKIKYETNIDIVNNNDVIYFYSNLITEFNKEFNHVEQIKKFKLLPEEWSVETSELTPKLSLKRKIIEEKYSNLISELYDQS